jgi:hypothetical protein
MNATNSEQIELDPIEIDSRACSLCGFKIDRHEMVDDGEGPIFYCQELDVDDDVADIVRRLELADPRDRWKHTGEAAPPESIRNSDISAKPNPTPPYRTAQATVDAFWYVVGLADPERFKAWISDHPKDAPFLINLLESK